MKKINDTFIGHQDIVDIAKHKNPKGAISLYIYSSVDETERDFASHFNSLNDMARREAEEFKPNNKNLKQLAVSIEKKRRALLDCFMENKAQTFCLFLSNDFDKFFEMPVRVKERAVVNSEFYTMPLLALLEQFERFAILVFGHQKARLFNYYLGNLQEDTSIFHNYVYAVPEFDSSASSRRAVSEKNVHHKIDDKYRRHLKEISGILFDNFRKFGFDKLLLASHQSEINSIKRHLHSYLIPRLAGEFTADVDDSLQTIKEKADTIIAEHRKNKEKTKAIELLNNHAHNRAVLGVESVLESLISGNVRELVLTDDFHAEGFICPEGHFATVTLPENRRSCVFCGKDLVVQPFLEDQIIEKAFAEKVEIFHIFHQKDLLAGYEIGALLRF